MTLDSEDALRAQVLRARSKFIAMATCYSLGVMNDNLFRQATLLLAVGLLGRQAGSSFQEWAIVLFSVPYLLFAAPAGWLADRFAKHHVVVGSKALELLAMLCGAWAVCSLNWPLMAAMVFLMGLQSAIFSPSLNGSIPELYPESYVTAANARLKVATTASIFIGVALAGFAVRLEDLLRLGQIVAAGVPPGRIAVAALVLMIAAGGFVASFGVPRRRAADPHARFPWRGPAHTIAELWRIRRDRLLAVAIAANAFVWFAGSLELQIINVLGKHQYGLMEWQTSGMILAQLTGIAAGGLLSSRLARGRHWYRTLAPAALGIGACLLAAGAAPVLSAGLQLPLLFLLFAVTGAMGGLILIPTDAFIQTRPEPRHRGSVLAAAGFAAFVGIMLSGPLQKVLLAAMRPTSSLAVAGAASLAVAVALVVDLPPGPGNLFDILLAWLVRRLLRLRYRIAIAGLDEVARRGTEGILFLPNHPALIDPVILMTTLFSPFAPRAWADEDQIDRPVIRALARRAGVRAVPRVDQAGRDARRVVRQAIQETVADLSEGRSVLLYPSGHLYRSHLENLRGNTAVHSILQELPDVRVVLVRTRGLWGSGFSWASGRAPAVVPTLRRGIRGLLASGGFFAPRRRVTIEFCEPPDLPRTGDRHALNACLQDFYNKDAPPNIRVPCSIWEKGGTRPVPEPFIGASAGDLERVPAGTRALVIGHLREAAGVAEVSDGQHLARDLGMDSLSRAELIAWVESEFGLPAGDPDSLQTVADVLLAACGEAVQGEPQPLKPVPALWFRGAGAGGRLAPAEGATVAECFLNAASRCPDAAAVADQLAGVKTYRDLIAAVLALRPELERLPGERIGIMMPASVTAGVLYLTALFAGRTPVMVNWTVGPRNVVHCLDAVGVQRVLTARALVDRLTRQGTDLGALGGRFVYLEDVARGIGPARKAGAWLRSRLSWASLRKARVPHTAVVLFTSGSESLPKAVPLTHENLLTNVRDICRRLRLQPDARVLGILPPFHSFGLTGTVLLPLCTGARAVYHSNPTEGGMIARMIEAYGVSVLPSTPSFLSGILRASGGRELAALRLVVTGAEKCPERVRQAASERCAGAVVLEGYGVTECSPIVSVNTQDDPRPGTIGRVLPSVEHAIVAAETGERVPAGRRGMLLVRGPSVFEGYLGEAGRAAFVELDGRRWYRTGDLVEEDGDGVLTFCGRLKRFTKLGGEMISLPAIEDVLRERCEKDEEGPLVAVEATPDEERPEIVLFTTLELDREAVNALIRQAGLSPLHNVRRVIRLDEIPVLGTGKADYRALRELLKAQSRPDAPQGDGPRGQSVTEEGPRWPKATP